MEVHCFKRKIIISNFFLEGYGDFLYHSNRIHLLFDFTQYNFVMHNGQAV